MSHNCTLIIGESGTGKSTSLRTLDPSETFIINILGKMLPFKGANHTYTKFSTETPAGNYYATDDHLTICRLIRLINDKKPGIKNLVIDDFQYVMCNEFMRRAGERGFDKFTEIGQHAWNILKALTDCTRDDLYCFVLSHSDADSAGRIKCKTIGKLLEEKIALEGMMTTVLHSLVIDGEYKFLTQYEGNYLAKSPMGMFDSKLIENDLGKVKELMVAYNTEGV